MKEKRVLAGLVFAFAVFVFVELLLLGGGAKQKEMAVISASTVRDLEDLNRLVFYLTEAESGRRGYLIQGDERYLHHHTNLVGKVQQALQELRDGTQSSAAYSTAFEQLSDLVQQRLAVFTNSIAAIRLNGIDPQEQVRFMEEGERVMEPLRQLVSQVTATETTLLKARQAKQVKDTDAAAGLALLVSIFGLVLFASLFLLLLRAQARRQSAEEALQQANLRLEERVRERTAELSETSAKAAWLASFPENNPNPVIEVDLASNVICYANPYARSLFPDLQSLGIRHAFLAGVRDLIAPLLQNESGPVRRELIWDGACYMQTLSYLPEHQRVRVYATDISERKDIERQLAIERSLLRTLIDAIPDIVFTKDRSGRFSLCNAAEVTHLGASREEEILGKTVFDLFPSELASKFHEDDLLALSGQPVLNREEHSLDVSLGPRWYLTTKVPLRDPSGEIIGLVGMSRDITNRKHAEEELRNSELRFRQIAESLPQLIWTCEPTGSCDYLSRQWIEFTGIPVEQQLGFSWLEQIHPDDRASIKSRWEKAVTTGGTYRAEFRIRRHDGQYRWFDTRADPLRGSDGRIDKWFGSNTDVTDRKLSEQRIRDQLARLDLLGRITRSVAERQDLRSILQVVIGTLEDDLPIDFGAILLVEPNTRSSFRVANVGTRSLRFVERLALAKDTLVDIGTQALAWFSDRLVYAPDTRTAEVGFARGFAEAGLQSLVLVPLKAQDQKLGFLVVARSSSEAFSSGECEFLRQLSEHVGLAVHQAQLHAELQRAYDELHKTQQAMMRQERLRALGQMASGIAHDINNAISPVTLYTESILATETGLSSDARQQLEMIQRAIGDVAHTVKRLGDFYRTREPATSLNPVNLNTLVRQAIDLTRASWSDMAQLRRSVIEAETQLLPDAPEILGIEAELRDALINLILNAIDAMSTGGKIIFRSFLSPPGRDGRSLCLDVKDSGMGMDEETLRCCLEPFFTTKGDRGTGLGLAMVYGTVKRHKGTIEINSSRGEGTTVRLSFPVPQQPSAGGSAREATDVTRPSPLRVLVVDDDEFVAQALRAVLKADGHTVVCAGGGEEGISTFRKELGETPFSVVITDLGMPYVDGRQVASAIKSLSPATPIILLTGWGTRMSAEGEIPPHVDVVLGKPPSISDLRGALLKCVNQQEKS